MTMIPLERWAEVIEAQIGRLPAAANLVLEGLGVRAEEDAKGMIGEYQPGWPDLAASTVAEKEKLGYAPPDNPLLREGDMRDSIGHGIVGDLASGGATLVVGSPSVVALWQEMGTQTIQPRPFLGKAIINVEKFAGIEFGQMTAEVLGSAR